MAIKIYPIWIEYYADTSRQDIYYNSPPYDEFDIYASAAYGKYKYAVLTFDISEYPRETLIEQWGVKGKLTDKLPDLPRLSARIALGTRNPASPVSQGFEDLGLLAKPSSYIDYNPLEFDEEYFPSGSNRIQDLATAFNPNYITIALGVTASPTAAFYNLVGIQVVDAYLQLAIEPPEPPPEDMRVVDVTNSLRIEAEFYGQPKPVPPEFRVPGPRSYYYAENVVNFENMRAAAYSIRVRAFSPDNALTLDAVDDSYLAAGFYTGSGGHYPSSVSAQEDYEGIFFQLDGVIADGQFVDLYGMFFEGTVRDRFGGSDVLAIKIESVQLTISGDEPPDIEQPPQPDFTINKEREMLERPPPWYQPEEWGGGPETHIGYLVNLGDEVSGSKPLQHLVTMDVPGQRVLEGTITNNGLVIAVVDYNGWNLPIYTLPVPGASRELDYDAQPKMRYRWRSKVFVFPGRTTLAAAKVAMCGCEELIFRLYERGEEVFATYVCNSEPFRLPPNIVGVEFQIELQGTAEVHEVHVASSMRELIEEG